MTNRRNFLKNITMLSATAALPMHDLFAQNTGFTAKPVDEGMNTVSYRATIRSVRIPPRNITIPDSDGFKVLKGDFHIHTMFSDGAVMPQDRVREAIDNGLDVISITDHINSAIFRVYPNIHDVINITDQLGARAPRIDQNIPDILAKPEAEKNELILIRGVEIATRNTTREMHLNCLFVKDINAIAEMCDRRTLFAEDNEWQKMLAVSSEQGGFNFWNHPDPGYGNPKHIFDELEEVRKKGYLHGIEAFNGMSYYPFVLDFCNERDLVPFAITDIHASDCDYYGHQNLLRPMTLVLAKERSHDSVREAFFAGRLVCWAANMILGRSRWVEQLFKSSVAFEKTAGGLALRNLSDIPCFIEANGRSYPLAELGATATIPTGSPKLTVTNWLVGTAKPLEITI